MRVTQRMMSASMMTHLQRQADPIRRALEQLSSGQRMQRPSDHPADMGQMLTVREALSAVEQHSRNVIRAKERFAMSESTLSAVDELLDRARSIAMSAEQDPGVMADLAEEVAVIQEQIVAFANTRSEEGHLFAGHLSHQPPFLPDGTYQGDGGEFRVAVGAGVAIRISADGRDVFTPPAGVDIFATLESLRAALAASDPVQVASQVTPLTAAIDQVNLYRAESAVRHSQLEMAESHLAVVGHRLEETLADTGEIDMAEVIMELQRRETAYEASLAASARLFETGLLQYLR